MNNPGRGRAAFTLVELLVVIGVIALLIGLLMPALAAAREASASLKCLSNLRQMALAAQTYANLNRGYFPPAVMAGGPGSVSYGYSWDYTIVTDMTDMSNITVDIRPGLLWSGQTNLQIQQCPSFDGKAMASHNPWTGYNYNTSYVGRGLYAGGSRFDPPAKVTQVRQTAETILFGDGQYASGANKFMRSPAESGHPSDAGTPRSAGTQGFRHRGGTNAAFCDGHAETLYERFGEDVAPGTGFVSEDNRLYDLE